MSLAIYVFTSLALVVLESFGFLRSLESLFLHSKGMVSPLIQKEDNQLYFGCLDFLVGCCKLWLCSRFPTPRFFSKQDMRESDLSFNGGIRLIASVPRYATISSVKLEQMQICHLDNDRAGDLFYVPTKYWENHIYIVAMVMCNLF